MKNMTYKSWRNNESKRTAIRVAVVAFVASMALTVLSFSSRLPDSTGESASGAINTTVGHWAISTDGSLNTESLGIVISIR